MRRGRGCGERATIDRNPMPLLSSPETKCADRGGAPLRFGWARGGGLVLAGGVLGALLAGGLASYAGRPGGGATPVPPAAAPAVLLPAMSAEEERLAAALRPIHDQVKLAAIRVTFAGIHFASEAPDAERLRAEVEPAIATLEQAVLAIDALAGAGHLDPLRERYRRAVGLYREAALAILEGAPAGDGARLLEAQRLSVGASEETLRIGDRLWPAEYKPH
jgi:hypothetical protein